MRGILTLICIIFVFAMALSSYANEVLIPFDSSGTVTRIDATVRNQTRLFADYPNFWEAQLFQESDSVYFLEISSRDQNRISRRRLPLSKSEVDSLRLMVNLALHARGPGVIYDQQGRAKLMVGYGLLSVGFYGWAIPYLGEMEGHSAVATYLILGSAGFIATYLATDRANVTDGAASASLNGATRGILHGVLLDDFMRGEDATARSRTAAALVLSLGEGIGKYFIAAHYRWKPGTVEMQSAIGDLGFGVGAGVAAYNDWYNRSRRHDRQAAGAMLGGCVLGTATGHYLARLQSYSRGDAYIMRGSYFLGAALPIGIVALDDHASDQTYIAAALSGAIAGAGVGHYLTRKYDYTTRQGAIILAMETAGALFGSAIMSGSKSAAGRWIVATSGAATLFGLTLMNESHKAPRSEINEKWGLNISPTIFLDSDLSSSQRSVAFTPGAILALRF